LWKQISPSPEISAEREFHRRLGHSSEAEISFHRALDFARTEPQQRFLLRKLASLRGAEGQEN